MPAVLAPPAAPPRPGVQPATGGAHDRWIERAVVLFFVLFLLVFPKGGIKVGGIPITWGYLGIGAFLAWLPLALLSGRPGAVRPIRLLTLGLLVPFQLVSWLVLLFNGVGAVGFTISFFATFFAVPLVLVLGFGIYLDRIDLGFLLRAVRGGVLAVAAYGIFLFVYKLATGSFIEIPMLTVNIGDLGELESKNIDRGGIFKLISTYNNGNIYGISILMLLPLYAWLERRWSRQAVVKLSLLLTLSRTVWAGLILFEILHRVYLRPITRRALLTLSASLVLVAAGVAYLLDLLGVDAEFLFDRRLGGRIGQLEVLETATWFPGVEFTDILEMIYLSVLENFGIVGLAAFLLAMTGPLLLYAARALPQAGTPYKRSLAAGLAIYLFVALSDGALLFIPVMAIYWFVVSLLLSDNPTALAASGAPPRGSE